MSNETKTQEMQILEQNIQNILLQKQAFQMELSETNAALKEIEKAKDEVFKMIGQLMIETNKQEIKAELENKKKMLDLKIKTMDKQEALLSDKIEKIRKEITDSKTK